jgi:DNA-binding XRE family transcriptional regulator
MRSASSRLWFKQVAGKPGMGGRLVVGMSGRLSPEYATHRLISGSAYDTVIVSQSQALFLEVNVMVRIVPYNGHQDAVEERLAMSKRKVRLNQKGESFGDRLARLRQAAGLSQRDLAAEVGISQRMVAYYEKETGHPPTHLFPLLVWRLVNGYTLFGGALAVA